MIVVTQIPETVDQVCRRFYGDESGYVEVVLDLNAGLAVFDILPVGTTLALPDVEQKTDDIPVVSLWD